MLIRILSTFFSVSEKQLSYGWNICRPALWFCFNLLSLRWRMEDRECKHLSCLECLANLQTCLNFFSYLIVLLPEFSSSRDTVCTDRVRKEEFEISRDKLETKHAYNNNILHYSIQDNGIMWNLLYLRSLLINICAKDYGTIDLVKICLLKIIILKIMVWKNQSFFMQSRNWFSSSFRH